MGEHEQIIDRIAETLQRVYGDATQTVLDRKAAREVFKVCTEMGMAPLSSVAAIIAAAGGRVTVPHDLLIDGPTEVTRIDEIDGITFKVSTAQGNRTPALHSADTP